MMAGKSVQTLPDYQPGPLGAVSAGMELPLGLPESLQGLALL